jgi:hypothetical protein
MLMSFPEQSAVLMRRQALCHSGELDKIRREQLPLDKLPTERRSMNLIRYSGSPV